MYKTKADMDEHINVELDRLISKLDKQEQILEKCKNLISNYKKNTKQDENTEEKLDSIITKCNNAQDHIRSKKSKG